MVPLVHWSPHHKWHLDRFSRFCRTLLQTDNHATTPPLSFLQAGCPSCRPTNSVKALKETWKQKYIIHHVNCTTQMHSSIGKHCTQPYSMPKCNKCNYRKSKWPPVTGEPAEIYINRTFWRLAKQIIEIGTEN